MSNFATYALFAAIALVVVAGVIYAFRRDAEAERVKTAKVLMLKQVLPASRSYSEAAAEVQATLVNIEASAFSDTDDAYSRNHISVSGERNGFYGTNNIGPP